MSHGLKAGLLSRVETVSDLKERGPGHKVTASYIDNLAAQNWYSHRFLWLLEERIWLLFHIVVQQIC